MMFLLFQTKILQFHRIIGNKRSSSEFLHLANIFYSQKREISFFLNWFITVFNSHFVIKIILLVGLPSEASTAFDVFKRLWEGFIVLIYHSMVDGNRLALLGPDCTCAEWLLRNGAAVRFKGHLTLLSDYNELMRLEEAQADHLKVEEIYAKGAWLNPAGFDHLRGCEHVNKITLIFCTHLFDSALFRLEYVKDTLKYLEVRSCFNIQDEGLKSLKNLKNLKILIIGDLVSVKNKDECEIALRKALPQCKIEFEKGD